MSKHTPGPWNCTWDDDDIYDEGGVYRVRPVPVGGTWDSVFKQYQANSRLIAAAPEMYELLGELLEAYPEWAIDPDDDFDKVCLACDEWENAGHAPYSCPRKRAEELLKRLGENDGEN